MMTNMQALATGVVAAIVAAVLMNKLVLPMRLTEMKRLSALQGRDLSMEEEERTISFFRYVVSLCILVSFTISSLYILGDVA